MTVTSPLPSEILTLIENHIDGFNTHNTELLLGLYGDTAVIIDGIAPWRWMNPSAAANWIADSDKWFENLGVSGHHLSVGMAFGMVEGSYAYAVLAGTYTATMKDQTVVRPGTLIYTFSKHNQEWKIDAQVWGRTA